MRVVELVLCNRKIGFVRPDRVEAIKTELGLVPQLILSSGIVIEVDPPCAKEVEQAIRDDVSRMF